MREICRVALFFIILLAPHASTHAREGFDPSMSSTFYTALTVPVLPEKTFAVVTGIYIKQFGLDGTGHSYTECGISYVLNETDEEIPRDIWGENKVKLDGVWADRDAVETIFSDIICREIALIKSSI
ncbi:MAG: hypothetical protein ACI9VM_000586 [Candidatus Azotimanducaceae bacterium]|jgi:hypothetical protein